MIRARLTWRVSRAGRVFGDICRKRVQRELLGPDQLPSRRQFDEVVRLAIAIALALVVRIVVDVLARIVCDVRYPVG
jgi:hypothetical protein